MARDKDSTDETGAPSLMEQQAALASMIGKGVAEGIVAANSKFGPVKQIPITAYVSKTPSNPLGLPEEQRPQLTRRYFQNGYALDAEVLSDEQRTMLNQLRPGSYIGHRVDVAERYPESGGYNIVDIRYNNASYEQRIDLKGIVRDFTVLLRTILEEQNTPVPA